MVRPLISARYIETAIFWTMDTIHTSPDNVETNTQRSSPLFATVRMLWGRIVNFNCTCTWATARVREVGEFVMCCCGH